MAYQLYRNTTLGNSLQESLDELIQSQQITPQLALQVLLQFDKAINAALAQRVRNRVNFRGSLNTYRFCDNVWTFVLNDVEFREVTELIKVDKVKIVACDGKSKTTFKCRRYYCGRLFVSPSSPPYWLQYYRMNRKKKWLFNAILLLFIAF
uniref:Transcription initiation factor IIA subunit 2 n=1 Tax=Capra hircus TaxID=9925 RepID=A0A8C2QWR1_CAPHI